MLIKHKQAKRYKYAQSITTFLERYRKNGQRKPDGDQATFADIDALLERSE